VEVAARLLDWKTETDCRTLQEPSEDNIISGTDLLCLNRIIKPQIPLEEFLQFTSDLGVKYVEARNDFTDKGKSPILIDA
jgi:hypothetical protein